jgi:hypothetical protein
MLALAPHLTHVTHEPWEVLVAAPQLPDLFDRRPDLDGLCRLTRPAAGPDPEQAPQFEVVAARARRLNPAALVMRPVNPERDHAQAPTRAPAVPASRRAVGDQCCCMSSNRDPAAGGSDRTGSATPP